MILDRDWTQPLPIYTYLIEHAEGLLLLDSGECARSANPGWFPWWNPFFSCAVDIHVEPDDEIGPRLRSLGIDPTKDLKSLVLSHLHHDHADGVGQFEGTDIDGVTGVVQIVTSHASVHTFSDRGYVSFDLYSCKSFDHALVQALLRRQFGFTSCEVYVLKRGVRYPARSGA